MCALELMAATANLLPPTLHFLLQHLAEWKGAQQICRPTRCHTQATGSSERHARSRALALTSLTASGHWQDIDMKLDAIVAVVDAAHLGRQLAAEPEAAMQVPPGCHLHHRTACSPAPALPARGSRRSRRSRRSSS